MDSSRRSSGGHEDGSRAEGAEPIQPRVLPSSYSALTMREIRERLTEQENVELDLNNPQRSAWLKEVFKQLQSSDSEARFFALWRFKVVTFRMLETKGPELSAAYVAYVLEEGILKEVIRLLKAARTEGDVYLYPKVKVPEDQAEPFTLSKFAMALVVLPALMLDARTTRFVWKAIPDILSVLEGAYFSLPVVFSSGDANMCERLTQIVDDKKLRDDHKIGILSVLVRLTEHLEQARKKIGSRKKLIRKILQDCLANTEFSARIIIWANNLFTKLLGSCELTQFLDSMLEIAFKTLSDSEDALTIKSAISLLAQILQDWDRTLKKFFEYRSNPRAERVVGHLLALGLCPSLERKWRRMIYVILPPLSKDIMTIWDEGPAKDFPTTAQEAKLKLLFTRYPEARERSQKLHEIFAANDQLAGSAQGLGEPGMPSETFSQKHGEDPLWKLPEGKTYTLLRVSEGEQVQADKRLRRKCSRSSCCHVEAASCEFRVCSRCRLAVYCSRDCQKLAWKEGQKLRCQAGHDTSRLKGKKDAP